MDNIRIIDKQKHRKKRKKEKKAIANTLLDMLSCVISLWIGSRIVQVKIVGFWRLDVLIILCTFGIRLSQESAMRLDLQV